MNRIINHIIKQFSFEGDILLASPIGEGLINDTFYIETSHDTPNYILQRKNKNIFCDIPAMMENMEKVTKHLRNKILLNGGNPLRETITIIPTLDNKLYCIDENGDYWTACLYIENTITYYQLYSNELASKGGECIGKFQYMLSDFNEPLTDILPGFHNIRYRFDQWDEILQKNPVNRKEEVKEEIEWIESRRNEMLAFRRKIENGEIPTRITHNDTKISNILFDESDHALCMIDLDTVLNGSSLNDYGDAIRSYANAGLEDDENIENVFLKMDIFESFTFGYLAEAIHFLTPIEINHLVFSAKYITFEQVMRFLMDYIDGDNYYKIKYEKHNLIRTRAQYRLLTSIEENFDRMNEIIQSQLPFLKEN